MNSALDFVYCKVEEQNGQCEHWLKSVQIVFYM